MRKRKEKDGRAAAKVFDKDGAGLEYTKARTHAQTHVRTRTENEIIIERGGNTRKYKTEKKTEDTKEK